MAQTVEALSYIRNNTGSIHYLNKRIFYTWNSYWVNSACTDPSSSSTSLSFRRLCIMLIYQCDVLHMGAKFGKENGACLYFVYRIKGNLRRPQLVSTEGQVWIFLKIPGTVVDIRTMKHFHFKLMLVCSLC